jgi:hypothetical protein
MHALSGRLLVGALVLALAAMAGCKKGAAGTVPVKSPMATFVAPDADEVFPEEEADEAADDAGDEE